MRTIELLYEDKKAEDLLKQVEISGCKDLADFFGKATALYTVLLQAERDGGAILVKQSEDAKWEPFVLSDQFRSN